MIISDVIFQDVKGASPYYVINYRPSLPPDSVLSACLTLDKLSKLPFILCNTLLHSVVHGVVVYSNPHSLSKASILSSFSYCKSIKLTLFTFKLNHLMFVATVFNVKSTRENPVQPISAVVPESDLARFVSKYVDDEHYVVFNYIKTSDNLDISDCVSNE